MKIFNSLARTPLFKKLDPLINVAIVVFWITNIWITLFTGIVEFLNYELPYSVKENFYRPEAVFPEPYEILTYLTLTFFFVLLIWIIRPAFHSNFELSKRISYWKCFLLLVLIWLFLTKLGKFPLLGETHPFSKFLPDSAYGFLLVFYWLTIGFLIFELTNLRRILQSGRYSNIITFVFTAVTIAFFIFEPQFPTTHLNYSFFYGPVWEIIHGKTIYTDIPSQYGFLAIFFLSLLHLLGLNIVTILPILIWILFVIMYFLSFYLIFKLSSSLNLALLGLFSLITIHYYSYIQSPQSGPLRWLPVILVCFIFYIYKSIDSKKLIILLSLLSLWFIDSGISIILGYLFTLLLFFLLQRISFIKVLKAIIFLFFSLALILITLNIFHLLFGSKPIDFLLILQSISKHASTGLVMIPIASPNYFWLFVLIYFAAAVYVFKNNGTGFNLQLILLTANLSLFAGAYFVGRSAADYLFKISIFPILVFFLIIGNEFNRVPEKIRLLIFVLIFLLLIAFPSWARKEFLVESLIRKYENTLKGDVFGSQPVKELQEKYSQEIEMINHYFTDKKELVILSVDDTYLFYLLNKKNLLNFNPLIAINTPPDMNKALISIKKVCPPQIVADCTVFEKCEPYQTFTDGARQIIPEILKQVETACNLKYRPVECTKKLCIAEGNLR